MAISRNQLVKELEPGLNALFGLDINSMIKNILLYTQQSHLTELSKRKLCCQVSLKHK